MSGSLEASVLAPVERHAGRVLRVTSLGGGCIAHASRVEADRGTFFLKHASGETGGTFEAEAAGLRALRLSAEETGLGVPEVLEAQNARGMRAGFLLLSWVEPGRTDFGYWARLGEGLSRLHRKDPAGEREAAPRYGFFTDNFIGRLPQRNTWRAPWPAFFREERLAPQLERARQGGLWDRAWDVKAERLLARLEDLLPARPHPSLVHGDLWSGNHLPGAEGTPWLVDPAAYVGDREVDLAMTELFGGFDAGFYGAYSAAWPLEPDYEERREVYNLYHLLNHLNHFGGSYAQSVARVLARFG